MIIKRRYTKSFVTLENRLVRDRRLTLDEHGMLHYLLSLPDDWEVSRAHCAKFWGIGRDRAARIFRSLRKCGWAQVERVHGEDGTFLGVRWIITDEPGEEISEAALDQEPDADDDAPDVAEAPDTPASVASEHHDTENPEHGSPVVRVTRDTDKAYHGVYIDSKKTDSEENRLPQNGARENFAEISEGPSATFTDLLKLWPSGHVLSRVAAEQAWQRMARLGRQQAFAMAQRYLDDCRSNTRKVCDLTTYLREERFERFAQSGKRGVTFDAKAYSAQWHRWRDYMIAVGRPIKFMETQAVKGIGWTVPSEWPPALPSRLEGAGPPDVLMTEEDAAELK